MKSGITLALLASIFTIPGAAATKANPADYPLTATVMCSFARTGGVRVGVLLGGASVEMTTYSPAIPVALGDYKLKLIRDKKQKSYEVDREYEMLMPDGTTRLYSVTGVGAGICSAAATS